MLCLVPKIVCTINAVLIQVLLNQNSVKLKLLPFFLVAFATLTPVTGEGGEIRGNVKQAGQPVPHAQIEIAKDGNNYASTTDQSGFFRVFVPKPGPCMVTVLMKNGQTASANLNSFDRSVQYDLMLVGEPGHYNLIVK